MKVLFTLFLTFAGIQAMAQRGGTTIGSGGDALRELFANAKEMAASKVEQLNFCSFDHSVSPNIRSWILQNQTLLAKDIRLSQHSWVVDSQSTCAFTNHSPQSTVFLSYPTCAFTSNNLNSALFVLIHESAHHLGLADENQADELARTIANAAIVPTCSVGNGVFDPNICASAPMSATDAGGYFKAGEVEATIGKYEFYGRVVRCAPLSGCAPVKNWKVRVSTNIGDVNDAKVVLNTTSTYPYFASSIKLSSEAFYLRFPVSENHFLADLGSGMASERGEWHSYYSKMFFKGSKYRDDGIWMWSISDSLYRPEDVRLRRDCLWSKWTKTFSHEGGATESMEVVLYGTH